MTPDDEYLERARRIIEQARVKKDRYRGDCFNCAFFKTYSCTHPFVVLAVFNLNDPVAQRHLDFYQEQRKVSSEWGPVLCGPNGVLFEPRRSWLARLLDGIRPSRTKAAP